MQDFLDYTLCFNACLHFFVKFLILMKARMFFHKIQLKKGSYTKHINFFVPFLSPFSNNRSAEEIMNKLNIFNLKAKEE